MEVVYRRCVGLDVSKRDAKACLRVQGSGSRATSMTVSTWGSALPQILKLRDHLVAERVQRVVMESTGDYWRPFFYVLAEKLDVALVKASDVKAIPGRKSDVIDCEWLAELAAHELVRPSLVPPPQQRHLRDLTRARVKLLQDRAREVQRLEKDLEDACIKLAAVATDLQGVSARAMLAALTEGRDDPAVMAELAKGRMRAKINLLTEALTGRFEDHHAFLVTFRLRRIDAATADLAVLDARIDQLIVADEDFGRARELLLTIPGLGLHGAEELLAEIGPDMAVFETPQKLVAWGGCAPGMHESAGRRKNVKTRPGNRYVRRTLGVAAMAIAKRRHGFLSSRHRRLCLRKGHNRAIVATGHAILNAAWQMLTNHQPYHDLGDNYYIRRSSEHTIRRRIAELEAAGYTITRNEDAA